MNIPALLGKRIRIIRASIRARFKPDSAANGTLLVNIGEFWCPRHWAAIVESQKNIETAIDPAIAVMGVGRALEIRYNHELDGPVKHACEKIPSEILIGILDRSRGWL